MNNPVDPVLTVTMTVCRNGDIHEDTQTHGNTFADVYKGFVGIRDEIDRQINERRNCPFNPKTVRTDGEPVFAD